MKMNTIEQRNLNSVLISALEALKILINSPRKNDNGRISILIDPEDVLFRDLNSNLLSAKHMLEETSELATRMELRILEMQQHDAHYRLTQITGSNK